MIDLTKIVLPDTVEVEGRFYKIKTDFRQWLVFEKLLHQKSTYEDFNFIYEDEIPDNLQKGFEELINFFNPPKVLPNDVGESSSEKILDYEIDSDFIYAAFFEQYKIDLLETKNGKLIPMHWYKFQALLSGLHDTKLDQIISYRCYTPNDNDDYKKSMMKLKKMWQLPTEISEQTQKDLDAFNALFE